MINITRSDSQKVVPILFRNKFLNFLHYLGQFSHYLLILKSDHLQTHLKQYLLPPCILFFLQIMDIPIHFNNQCCFVTVKVNNEACNDLLPPEVDAQLISAQLLPAESSRQESYLAAQFFCALEFLFGDPLAGDNACPERSRRVFDWHEVILTPKPHPRLPPLRYGMLRDPLKGRSYVLIKQNID